MPTIRDKKTAIAVGEFLKSDSELTLNAKQLKYLKKQEKLQLKLHGDTITEGFSNICGILKTILDKQKKEEFCEINIF